MKCICALHPLAILILVVGLAASVVSHTAAFNKPEGGNVEETKQSI